MKRKLFFLLALMLGLVTSIQAKTDVTSMYLKNADLSTKGSDWTCVKYTDWQIATGANHVNVVEFWAGSNYQDGKFEISQSTTLPAGYYRLAVNAFYRNGWSGDGTNGTVDDPNAWIFAGTDTKGVFALNSGDLNGFATGGIGGSGDLQKASNAFYLGYFSNEFDFHLTEETTLSLGFSGKNFTGGSWCIFGPMKLYEYTVEDYYVDYDKKVEEAEALYDKPMNADVLQALQEAVVDKSTLTTIDKVINAIAVLNEAINNANTSISAYANANIPAYLEKMATVLDNTNVYTEEAYNKWYGNVQENYDNGLYTNEEVGLLNENGAYSTGWHANNALDDVLLSAWTIGGEQCKNYDKALYINTWSVEGATDGSEFLAPFFEYWTDDAKSLSANELVATVTGLKPSTTYSFTIRARVRQTNNQTKIADGVTMKVGDGESVDISAGSIFKTGPFFIGNFTAVGETDDEGNMTVTMTVAENSNISWLSFYNAKWTEGEDLSAYIADYEFALTTAIQCREDAAYAAVTGKERVDLNKTIEDYAVVDETSKADLIAAKEALESATATFVAAAPSYNGLAELNANVAATLGVELPVVTEETTAADVDEAVKAVIVAEYEAAEANYALDNTKLLGEWTDAPGTNQGQSWKDGSDNYLDLYNKADQAMTQTVTLPAGDYVLIAKGRASVNGRLTLVVGDETVTYPHKSSEGRGIATDGAATFADNAIYTNNNLGWGWEYRVMTFTSDGTTPITLIFNWKTSSYNWCGLDDIELRGNLAPAEQADYMALAAVAKTVKDNVTPGFLEGQYAPYNNIELLAVSAEAAEILTAWQLDPTVDYPKATVNAVTTALQSAYANKVVNTEEVNAIYAGDFNTYYTVDGEDFPYGWNLYNGESNHSRIMGGTQGSENAGLAATSEGKALLMKFNATYGEEDAYCMPLQAGTVYKISFLYGGWGNMPNTIVSLTDEANNEITLSPNFRPVTDDANSNAEDWYEYTGYFVTPATAVGTFNRFKLHFNKVESNQQQIVISDIDIRQAASQTLVFADDEMPTYAPGVYPAASYSREIPATSDYGTICVPFNVTTNEDIQYFTLGDIAENVLSIEYADNIEAGVPAVFKKKTVEATSIEVSTENATVVNAVVEQTGDPKLVGTFVDTTVDTNAEYCYYIKNNQFWKGNTSFNVGSFRAYIETNSNTGDARLTIEVDGETAINTLKTLDEKQGLKDGKYLIGGKVIVVKEGKQYNVNGVIK